MYYNVRNDKLVRNVWLVAIHILFAFHFFASPCYGQSWTADNGNGTFMNPLFYDEFSDPFSSAKTVAMSSCQALALPAMYG